AAAAQPHHPPAYVPPMRARYQQQWIQDAARSHHAATAPPPPPPVARPPAMVTPPAAQPPGRVNPMSLRLAQLQQLGTLKAQGIRHGAARTCCWREVLRQTARDQDTSEARHHSRLDPPQPGEYIRQGMPTLRCVLEVVRSAGGPFDLVGGIGRAHQDADGLAR